MSTEQPDHVLRPAYPIATPRLRLRPLTLADVDALFVYRSRADVMRYVPFEPMTRQDLAERVTQRWTDTELTDEGQALLLGIEPAGSGPVIGDVMLRWESRKHLTGEIGYVLDPAHVGHGYATESAHALLRLGFEELGLHRIIARIDERNDASAGVCRRLGLRAEARLVENEFGKGEWTTELDFAMLASEWPRHRDLFGPVA